MIKIVVAGCRDFNDYEIAKKFIDQCLTEAKNENQITFISGCCKGADLLGERYALDNGFEIERFPADWIKYKKAAGVIRNKQMAEASDIVICFWDGKSKGTKSMIDLAKKMNKKVFIKFIGE